jgi:hypothetical protein
MAEKGGWGGTFDQRVFRAKVLFTRAGQKCQTGFHLRDVGINTLDPEEVATEVAAWATTSFRTILQSADQITGIDVENLVTREGFSISPANVMGAYGGTPAPSYLSVTVSLKGSIRRRYGNGRMLWPMAVLTNQSGNVMSNDLAAIYEACIDDMEARFLGPDITTSMHLIHLHDDLKDAGGAVVVPKQWYDITSLRLNRTFSSLRSRQVGHGS